MCLYSIIKFLFCIKNNKYKKINVLNNEPEYECPICLTNDDLDFCILKCSNKHIFHTKCIKKWHTHDNNCPICRSMEI